MNAGETVPRLFFRLTLDRELGTAFLTLLITSLFSHSLFPIQGRLTALFEAVYLGFLRQLSNVDV